MDVLKKKILIVDDEPKILSVIRSYLEAEGFDVFEATNGKVAIEIFENISPSLVILDLMLPDLSGENICEIIRSKSNVPIIMLTAKTSENSILDGFELGADDYITKPFSPKQLVARVMSILRRVRTAVSEPSDIYSFNNGDLIVDTKFQDVRKNFQPVNLTPNEYKILMTLIKHPKKTFTRDELIFMAIGEEFDGYDRTIDTHIKNLRHKIESDPRAPSLILTVYGLGYKFGGEPCVV